MNGSPLFVIIIVTVLSVFANKISHFFDAFKLLVLTFEITYKVQFFC